MTKKANIYVLLTMFIALLMLFSLCLKDDNFTYFFSVLFLWTLSNFFFKKELLRIFSTSFFFNIIVAVLLIFVHYSTDNKPFTYGGDDISFYDLVVKILDKQELPVYFYTAAEYKIFIYTQSYFILWINKLGIIDRSIFHLIVLNCFVGATIPVVTYLIGKNYLLSENSAKKAAYFICFFPGLVFYASVDLRDIWVVALYMWSIFFFLKEGLFNVFYKILGLILSLINIFGVRIHTGIMSIVTFGLFIYFKTQRSRVSKILLITAFFLIVSEANYFSDLLKGTENSATIRLDGFLELSNEQFVNSNSLGSKLINSNNIFSNSLIYFLGMYNPIPPFVTDNRIDFILLDIGALLWYFMIPGSLYAMLKFPNNMRLGNSVFYSIIVLLFILFYALGSSRHRLLITPFVILYYFISKDNKSNMLKNIELYHNYALFFAFLLYFSLKIIL